jgi:hypothetical protein
MDNIMIDFLIYCLHGKWRSRTLAENIYHDIFTLWRMRVVTVTAKGRSITKIYVDVKSCLDKPLKVLIPHGACFMAKGAHQNMVTRKEFVFALKPLGSRFLNVPASCVNAGRPIPGKADAFKGVKRVSPSVERFLRESDGYGPMVTQAGVWALTDGYDRSQIKGRLTTVYSDRRPRTSISDSDIDCAKGILDRLGISSNIR